MNKKVVLVAVILVLVAIGAITVFYFSKPKAPQNAIDQRYYNGPTGLNLVDQAFTEKKIDFETAIVYKVKFVFRDPSLPKEYVTKEFPFEEGGVFAEVNENWDKLSSTTKETLAPYFKRPDDPESYISKTLNGEIEAPKVGLGLIKTAEAFDRPFSYKSDDGLITADGKIKVWYLEKKEMVGGREKITKMFYATAQKIVANLNTDGAYAQFVGLLGKVPPSDGMLGGDGKLDIYIAPPSYSLLLNGNNPSSLGINAPDNGNGRSSFVIIKSDLNDKELKTTTVHEIFHAFQRAFDCWMVKTNWWWIEGTATWSEDFIYPKENTEQGHVPNYVLHSGWALTSQGDNFEYGAYLFPFYLSNTYDRMIITKIFEGCRQNGTPIVSAEKNIDGGFKKNWKEFTLWNYNKKPVEYYKKVDLSNEFTKDSSEAAENAENNFITGINEVPYVVAESQSLSAQVISFVLSDEDDDQIRKVTFKSLKNFTSKTEKAAIKAVIYPRAGEPRVEDWTDKESRSFCFDRNDDNFEKVVLVFSNADIKNKIKATEIKVKTTDNCFAIDQGETMTVNPVFAVTPSYVGTLKYQAEGELIKDSVPNKAKYPYLGKWKVKIDYLEHFPAQTVYGIVSSQMDFGYNHYLEFDLTADSVLKDGTFEAVTKEGKFQTPGWDVTNLVSGESVNIPQNTTMWDVPQKGLILDMTENGCKVSLPNFVLYNSGGYRDLPHPIVFQIKND